MKRLLILLCSLLAITGETVCAQKQWKLMSKDRCIIFTLSQEQVSDTLQLVYRVCCGANICIESSRLGVVMDGIAYGPGARLIDVSPVVSIVEPYTLLSGKRLQTVDNCNEQTFTFLTPHNTRFQLQVRAYTDGVAFRYCFPDGHDGRHTISSEATEFAVPVEGKAWIHPYDWNSRHKPSYEQYCDTAVAIRSDNGHAKGWAFPMLFNTNGLWMMITEACLDGTYPATHVNNSGHSGAYRIAFPEAEEAVIADAPQPVSTLPWKTPWRVIVTGNDLNTVFQTQIVTHLNPPCSLADVSWIKPGRSSWSWWSKGGTVTHYPTQLRYARLSHDMRWEYMLIDAGWQDMGQGGTMPDVVRYARKLGVGVWLWYHSGAGCSNDTLFRQRIMSDSLLRNQEMQRLQQLGIKGIKVDFFDTDKQRIIQLYPAILRDAANHRLMVDFHGATLPRGLERTYPNLMSTEAVRGAESLGRQERCNAAAWHNSVLPFTRNVVGSMDYTPVTFSNKIRQGVEARRMTTVAHQLALAVVFESGLQCFADRAEAYDDLPDQPQDFLREVPTAWDESVLLDGYPGRYAVVARRKGSTWYIGGINGSDVERDIDVAIPKGCQGHRVSLILDGADKDHFSYRSLEVAPSTIRIHLLPSGGFAATIRQ